MFTGMMLATLPMVHEKEYHLTKKPEVQIIRSFTSSHETPAPIDLGPSGIYATSTGQIVLMQATDAVIRHATRYIQDMAVLPINEHDEEIVDQLMARKQASLIAKPLTRKI
jgi:hypothetical protein